MKEKKQQTNNIQRTKVIIHFHLVNSFIGRVPCDNNNNNNNAQIPRSVPCMEPETAANK